MTLERLVVVGEVALSKDELLSDDLTMVPDSPTPTNVLFPKVSPLRLVTVGEVALSKDEPLSVDLTMFPEAPTPTNKTETDDEELSDEEVVVLSVVVVSSSVVVEVVEEPPSLLLLQEKMVRLKRNRERRMSRCFTWFPISGLGEPNIYHDSGVFYKKVGIRSWGIKPRK